MHKGSGYPAIVAAYTTTSLCAAIMISTSKSSQVVSTKRSFGASCACSRSYDSLDGKCGADHPKLPMGKEYIAHTVSNMFASTLNHHRHHQFPSAAYTSPPSTSHVTSGSPFRTTQLTTLHDPSEYQPGQHEHRSGCGTHWAAAAARTLDRSEKLDSVEDGDGYPEKPWIVMLLQ
ncbi:hypothetical protein OPT61_g3925 [Boeremia exigua]|uniref:Uncharacterized protein n=1 Tax=Boeremia exigua TaxID=749465 RepID=A0ACC2IG20_9PLEO|nr:hypothetical protein OPT61_g3925 [Boeremia exigua]